MKIHYIDVPKLMPLAFGNKYQVTQTMYVDYEYLGVRKSYIVPSSFKTDGASIPAIAWQYIGTPFEPRFMAAAIVHDHMCDNNFANVKEMSLLFRELLCDANVPRKLARKMYAAVYVYKGLLNTPEV